jgi:hypothetical protein
MNKLDALRILAHAYHYMNSNDPRGNRNIAVGGHDVDAEKKLFYKFHYVRRDLIVDDLLPHEDYLRTC